MVTRTHTRVHVFVEFADPFLICDQCGIRVTAWHDNTRCGCDASFWNVPCEHKAGVTTECPSWGPVAGCECAEHLGYVPHAPESLP